MGIIYTADRDNQLKELTGERAVAAVPLCGRYRLIDFPLSAMVDSGIRKIARVFDKGLQSLQEKKDKLMEKSAAINEKREAIYGRTSTPSQSEKPTEEKADNHLLDLNSLLKDENRDKAVSQLVDFLVKAGKKEEGITNLLSEVKVKAMAEMKKPEYKAVQAEAAAAR
jgi:ADP-glucose pyrophosphorylase